MNVLERQRAILEDGYTVEPLYNGHHWEPKFGRYSDPEVSVTQGNLAEKVDKCPLNRGR